MPHVKSPEMGCLASCCLAINEFVKGKCKVPVYGKTGKANHPACNEKTREQCRYLLRNICKDKWVL